MINFLYNNRKDIFVFFLSFFVGFAAILAWANHTQVAIYSQDIPPNLVCIKDTYPDAYLCIVDDQEVPWYLSSEGVLAHVQ
mgnify:FL=1